MSLFVFPTVVAVGVVDSDGEDPVQDTLRPISCRDLDPECENLANQRECEANPAYMEVACQESCGTCKPQSSVKGCTDQREECPGWGQQGECDLNPAFMNVNCPQTCNSCPPAGPEDCVDQHEFCFLGSLLGLCRTNPSFYLIFCADSCRRFIPVCVQGEASTVPELCLSRAQGEEVECGMDPTTAAVKRRKRRHTTVNTTVTDLGRGTTMTTTDHLLYTHIVKGSASPQGNVLGGNVLADQVNTSKTSDEGRNGIPYKNLLHTHIFRGPTTPQGNALDGHVVEVSHVSPSKARDERSREISYKSKTKRNWDERLSVAWSMVMEAMKKGIKWEKIEEEEEEASLGNGEWGRNFRWGYRRFTSRQLLCCIDTDDGGVVTEGPTPITLPQRRSLNSQTDYHDMLEEVHSDWKGQASEYGSAPHHQYTAWEERNTSGTENFTLWDERDSVMEEGEGYYRLNEQQGDQSLELQDSSTKVAKKSAADKTDDNVNEEHSRTAQQCPSDNEQCGLDDEQYLTKDKQSVTVHSPHQQSRVKRQIDCSGYDCESLNPCVVYLVTLETSLNLCIIIPPVIFLVFLILIDWNPQVEVPPTIPPPITFTLPPFTPEPTPPTPQPSSPSTPPPTTPTMPTSPSSTSQPTPSTTPLPLPLPEVRIRSLVPYCSGEGYLSLVERLQRLTTGNTGRPLNPIAASLTVAVNHCKYGVGTGAATVGSVPEAPPQLAFPTVASILLRDREANISLQKPQRWPGLSMPALYLYQPGGQPPPPLTPVVTPSIPSTNITVITVTVNGTVVSNTTQVVSGETPTVGEGLPEGGVPGGEDVSEGGVPGGEGLLGDVPGGEDVSEGVPEGGVPGGEGVPGDGTPEGPKPVTEESLGSRDSFSCGGALISPYHVLTAAHCLIAPGLTETAVTRFQKPSVVRLGEVDFERVDESQAFDYKVAGVQVHEGYALPAKYNDIAIITLENRVEFTSALRPYCLPQRQDELVGRRCTVSGWGRRPGGQVSTVLHNVEVEIVSREECGSAYLDDTATRPFFEIDYPDGVTPVVLCAGKINNVCRGDSGGPLVLEEAGIQQEVGVVSTGYGCGSVLYPGLYTRIDQFTAWIDAEIYGAC
ncbi:hypothetical protein Pcinc_020424 [Petrolisthes cinctipes]|uniref:Uncharacterized protein n=1 Tax=Petrolisthes cinctipes TaxID=88211 RepID=A0AAE1KJS9_PETCI|nr:hypothetical protein Pcinc_020424 [Petrolisthes cinctipes]